MRTHRHTHTYTRIYIDTWKGEYAILKKREKRKGEKRPELTICKDEYVIEKGIAVYTAPRQFVLVCLIH